MNKNMFKELLKDPKTIASILKDSGLLVLVGALVYFMLNVGSTTLRDNTKAMVELRASNDALVKSTDAMGALLQAVLMEKRTSRDLIEKIALVASDRSAMIASSTQK